MDLFALIDFALIDDPKMRTLLIAAATIAAVFVLLRVVRGLSGEPGGALRGRSNRPRRFGEAAASDSPPPSAPGHQRPEKPPVFDDWEVRMHETARELIGRIDAKLAALQALTHEADRAAARLEQALAAASREDAAAASGGGAAAATTVAAVPLGEQRHLSAAAGESQGAGRDRCDPHGPRADQADALRNAGDRNGLDLSNMPPSESRRHEEIYLLADYGYGPTEIAHRTGMPIGEVELILRLREKSS